MARMPKARSTLLADQGRGGRSPQAAVDRAFERDLEGQMILHKKAAEVSRRVGRVSSRHIHRTSAAARFLRTGHLSGALTRARWKTLGQVLQCELARTHCGPSRPAALRDQRKPFSTKELISDTSTCRLSDRNHPVDRIAASTPSGPSVLRAPGSAGPAGRRAAREKTQEGG